MNSLIAMTSEMAMGTREIAKMLGSRHTDILKSVCRLHEAKAICHGAALSYREFKTERGNTYIEYLLGKLDSITLVAQNCPQFTAALVKRWDELEAQQKPQLPTNYKEALIALVAEVEAREMAEQQLAIAAPKAEFVDRYVDATGSYTFRQVAKMLAIKENEFREFLTGGDHPVMYRLSGNLTPYANHVDAGRFIQRAGVADNDHAYTQCRFTAKGVEWIAAQLAAMKARKQTAEASNAN